MLSPISSKHSYIVWGSAQYSNLNIVLNSQEAFDKILTTNNTMFIDTEGCPNICMFQICIDNDPNIYIFNKSTFINKYPQVIQTHATKVFWGINDEITRLIKLTKSKTFVKLNKHKFIDLQEKYLGMGLKKAIGLKYNMSLHMDKETKNEFYLNKNWRKPSQEHLLYAALDVKVLSELFTDI